jgi:hypothetical protein
MPGGKRQWAGSSEPADCRRRRASGMQLPQCALCLLRCWLCERLNCLSSAFLQLEMEWAPYRRAGAASKGRLGN